MHKTMRLALLVLALMTVLLSASTAWCGRLVLVNNSPDSVILGFSTYYAGPNTTEEITVSGRGSFIHDDVIFMISHIYYVKVCPWQESLKGFDCRKASFKQLDYTVPGPWLPHRKFTVTYNSINDVQIEEK